MKPTSIIFLIVAAVLALGGLMTMRIAESIASKEGIELLSETAINSEDYIFTYEYNEDSIGKIALNIKDAKINIIGGAQKPYIELVNFAEGMYEFSSANRILNVSNNSEFSSVSGIASMALNFKGLRSLVNYSRSMGLEKTVNVYLCENFPVKIIDCSLETGEVVLGGNTTQTDYNINIGKGTLSASRISSNSTFSAEIETGAAELDNCVLGNLAVKIDTGDVNIENSDITRLDAEIKTGDFSYGYRYDIDYVNLDLFCGVGKVTIDGSSKGGYFEVDTLPTNSLYKITLGNGDIDIKSKTFDAEAFNQQSQ